MLVRGVYQEGRGNAKQPTTGRVIEKQTYTRGNGTPRIGMKYNRGINATKT